MGWLYLALAIAFEIGFTTALRLVDGYRNLLASAVFVAFILLGPVCLELANRSIPLGTAYAIWTGLGAAGTVLIGMIWFNEPATLLRELLIAGVIACCVGLKLTEAR